MSDANSKTSTDWDGRKPGRNRSQHARMATTRATGSVDGRIAYVRVSTAREEMVSPEIQEMSIRSWASATGVTIVDVVQDLDISGRGFAKRSISKIIDRIGAGEASGAVVYNFARFGRNAALALAHIAALELVGGSVVSATEQVDPETAIGRFTRTTALAVAELQSDQIADGWKAAIERRVAHGLTGGGQPRFGYIYHRETSSTRTCPRGCEPGQCVTGYVIDRFIGPVLAELYRSYLAGTSLPRLAEELEQQHVPSVRGGRWVTTTVRDLLDTGFGAGLIAHHGALHTGAHNGVITPKEWAAYVARREANSRVPTRHRNAVHSTAGIAVCGLCGHSLVAGSTGRDGPSYILRCGRMQSSGRESCKGVWIVRHAVESAVLEWLRPYGEELTRGTHAAQANRPLLVRPIDAEKAALQRRKVDFGRRIDRLTEVLELGSLPVAEYGPRRSALEAAIREVDLDLARLAVTAPAPPDPRTVQNLITGWDAFRPGARRDVLRALITRIVVHPRDTIPRVVIEDRWTGTA